MHELFIILKGNARMTIDDHPHALKPGDAISLAPGETHEFSNTSHEPLVFHVLGWTQPLKVRVAFRK